MPRKSKELRLSQAKNLYTLYVDNNLHEDYRCRFIFDMCNRLERGRGLSKKQRDWLDSLIEGGLPEPKGDIELLAKIESAATLDGMQHRSKVLQDFAGRVRRGYSLTQNQAKFLDVMLAEADKIRTQGKFRPHDVESLRLACELLSHKNGWYWAHRAGTEKAYGKVRQWLDWNTHHEMCLDLEASGGKGLSVDKPAEPHIDQWCCDKVLSASKKGMEEVNSPRHPQGSLRYVRLDGIVTAGVIMSNPRVVHGSVEQDILVNGSLLAYPSSDIRKRK